MKASINKVKEFFPHKNLYLHIVVVIWCNRCRLGLAWWSI